MCFADAISPLINLFTPDTAIPTAIITTIIIFVEAFLLRLWVKTVSFKTSLWRSLLMNLASSAAGSVLVMLFFKEKMTLDMFGLFIPMFVLTLIVETPIFRYLYRNDGVEWPRAAKLSFSVNFISYCVVFVCQFGLFFSYMGYADIADKNTPKKWNNLALFNGESGKIITTTHISFGKDNRSRTILKIYDVKNHLSDTFDPGDRVIDISVCDVKGDSLVCIVQTDDWNNQPLNVFKFPATAPINTIIGKFRDVRLSPDKKKIAALEYVKEASAPKDATSHFMLGSTCRLKIFDANTGALIIEAPRMALDDGITWANDSTHVFFTSLKDENLFKHEDSTTEGFGRGYAKEGQFPLLLIDFDLSKREVYSITEGKDPETVSDTNEISFLRDKGVSDCDVWRWNPKEGKARLILKEIKSYKHSVSPSGNKLLIQIPHKNPLRGNYFLTVIDPVHPERKHIVEQSMYGPFRWISD
jgi:hypothetical protein